MKSMVSSLVMFSLSDADWGYFLLTGKPVLTQMSRFRNHARLQVLVSFSSKLMNNLCCFFLLFRFMINGKQNLLMSWEKYSMKEPENEPHAGRKSQIEVKEIRIMCS